MEKKRKASLTFSVVVLALVVSMATGLFMQHSGLTPSYLVFAGDSSPDSYGNYIWRVEVEQPSGGSWVVVVSIPYSEYTEGMTEEIDANVDSRFKIEVRLNSTLAEGTSQAEDYTRVKVNVTDIWTNYELPTVWGSTDLGTTYSVIYTSGNFTMETDTQCNVDVKYEAYY